MIVLIIMENQIKEIMHEINVRHREINDYFDKVNNLYITPKSHNDEHFENLSKILFNKNINLILTDLFTHEQIELEKKKLAFNYYTPSENEKVNDISEFLVFINDFFLNYHPYFGKYFEDHEWTFHDNSSTKYELGNDEYIFDNSININYKHHEDNINYLNNMKRILKAKAGTNIKVKTNYFEDSENGLVWISVVVKLLNVEK